MLRETRHGPRALPLGSPLKGSTLIIRANVQDSFVEIRPVGQDDLDAVLEVYRQCEGFLALGPIATASMETVAKDIQLSKEASGVFCGIYTPDGTMTGVVDYVPNKYQGNPQAAFLSLLMIAAPFRSQGIGKAVVNAVEDEIRQDSQVTTIFSGVQVNNPQAIQFWLKHDYRIVSEPKFHPDQTTAVDLQKDIS